jgi:hypothetical protein
MCLQRDDAFAQDGQNHANTRQHRGPGPALGTIGEIRVEGQSAMLVKRKVTVPVGRGEMVSP